MSVEWTEIVLENCISAIIDFNFGMELADSFTQGQHPDLRAHQRNSLNNRARMVAGSRWDWVSRKTKSNPLPKSFAN